MQFSDEIRLAAARYGLDPMLVAGLISVESGFDPWAWNPEPRYRYFYDVRKRAPFRSLLAEEIITEIPPKDFWPIAGDADQEWWAQQASWGLMQIMGAVAREHGFRMPYLTELCHSDTNLAFGCLHLSGLLAWANGNVEQALSAYNGGKGGNSTPPFRNQSYASKVLVARSTLKV